MKNILSLLFCISIGFSFTQLTINNTFTPQQLVENILAGPGVVISNVTYNCDAVQIGAFGGNSNIGFYILEVWL